MDIRNSVFRRKFSFNLHKDMRIVLSKMTFNKDFLHTNNRGDLYPTVLEGGIADGNLTECVHDGKYTVTATGGAYRTRLIGEYFPFATCEATVLEHTSGELGFAFDFPDRPLSVSIKKEDSGSSIILRDGDLAECFATDLTLDSGDGFVVSSRYCAIDVFVRKSGFCKLICTFKPENYEFTVKADTVRKTKISLYERGSFTISAADVSVDCGLSTADIRPIKNECGEVLMERGRVYLSASIRTVELKYQGIFSWLPGTADLKLEGVIFFDVGDGIIAADVASSIVYDRKSDVWHVWYCSFSHGHVLAYVRSSGDVRFGVNVLDATLMPMATDSDPVTAFLGRFGDEDPDLTYDPISGKWYLTVCRLVDYPDKKYYRYFLFESDRPDGGFVYVTHTQSGDETGGNIVRIGDSLHFICGSCFDRRAEYHIYDLPDFSNLTNAKFDFDDGGFRGWGTVLPLKIGTRTRYFWLTFDRHLATHFNWSYGNIYCFEADGK